jgi:hypothetical protein
MLVLIMELVFELSHCDGGYVLIYLNSLKDNFKHSRVYRVINIKT